MKHAVLVLVASCTTGAVEPQPPASAPPLPPAPVTAAAPPAATPPEPAVEPTPPPHLPPSGRLAPPARAGEHTARVTGCAAEGRRDESAARGFPADTRKAPAPPSVSATGTGVIVSHELSHACCLGATVRAAVEGATVTVEEVLEGEPCRCMCSSTIETAVGLQPGSYDLSIVVVEGGERRGVHRQAVEVRRLGR
jgi:hypothetical protein